MNHYGNEYGFHNPKITERSFKRFKEDCNLEFIDGSWHNDLCDSLYHEFNENGNEYVQVFLPNSKKEDVENEEYNTYVVSDETQNILFTDKDIKKVIKFINENYEKNITK